MEKIVFMNLVKKSIYLVSVLLVFIATTLQADELNPSGPTTPVVPASGDGDFLPDTVNIFHIAKDVSEIFLDAMVSPVYHDINGDTTVLNKIFRANYTSNDRGQAYRAAIEQQIKAQKGDFGLNLRGDFTENFTPGLSIDEDLTFKRRFYLGLEWDIIKGGLFDASNKIHQLKMQAILKEYESLKLSDKENYRYLFNYINYIFNVQKLELLNERKGLVQKQLKYTKELYHLRYVGWEKVLKYQEQLDDIEHEVYQYKKFNKHIAANIPDTLLTQTLTANDLPLFDVDLDSLMKIYYGHHSDDTVTQLKLAIYKDKIKWWKDITLKPFVRYNMYVNEFDALRNYGSAGVNLRVPLRFHNKQKLIRTQEMVYESEGYNGLEAGGNELVNIYAEFGFKLKQIKAFYYKKILNDELIRKELVKKEYHDVAFNPVYTLGLIDDKKAIEAEIVDLKKRMYINLVRLAFYLDDRTPTNFITTLEPSDFTGRYEGSVKIFVTANDIENQTPAGIVNYLWKNEFNDVIIENAGEELSEDLKAMTDQSKFANIFYSIMKHIPKGGQYPNVVVDIDSLKKWDNPHIIGLHYELDLLAAKDTLDEVSEVEIADWISSIDMEAKGSVRLSIGIPSGLSISLLNRVFNKFDLVFVHERGVPNINRVGNTYASELNLNDEKFVLSLKGTDFADRIHLENYMASLYTSLGLSNFAFSDYSSLMEIDYKTYEKGKEIDLQPGELVASVRDQIYTSESNMSAKQQKVIIVEPEIEKSQLDTAQVVDVVEPINEEVQIDTVQLVDIVEPEVEEVKVDTMQVEIADSVAHDENMQTDDTAFVESLAETIDVLSDDVQKEMADSSSINSQEMPIDTVQTNPVSEVKTTETQLSANETIYRIQVAASKVKLKDEILESFKAEDIREIKINDYYKYTIGNYKNRKEASKGLKEYKASSGNTAAFLVTY
jgi:hypothetical protein